MQHDYDIVDTDKRPGVAIAWDGEETAGLAGLPVSPAGEGHTEHN